jgi:hypothetical protein
MSTPAQIRFVTRQKGQSFSEHPPDSAIHAQLYRHYDGNPGSLGLDIARSMTIGNYSVNYLEFDDIPDERRNLDFIYYIWQHVDKETNISIWEREEAYCPRCGREEPNDGDPMYSCIFVGTARDLIDKYNE